MDDRSQRLTVIVKVKSGCLGWRGKEEERREELEGGGIAIRSHWEIKHGATPSQKLLSSPSFPGDIPSPALQR